MLKSNCICIVLVIVAICIIAAIFIFCFCSKKNNYSRIGGGRIRGGDSTSISKINNIILGLNADLDINAFNKYTSLLDKINNMITPDDIKIIEDKKTIDEIKILLDKINNMIAPDDKKTIDEIKILIDDYANPSEQDLYNNILNFIKNPGLYSQKYIDLESENESLKNRISELEKGSSGSKIAKLESENSRLRNRISELESDNDWYGNIRNPYQIDAS